MQCQRCVGEQFVKVRRDQSGQQIYPCAACDRRQTDRSTSAFRGYRFPNGVIVLAVRWYLRFRLPCADAAKLLAERSGHGGLSLGAGPGAGTLARAAPRARQRRCAGSARL